ncbi:MAG: CDP-diacylglycerol--glycerol-3-phosphate 3-phosphatidyltransferase [Planctomycetota bacterium]
MNLPNRITLSRLVVGALLFVFLSLEIQGWGVGSRHLALNIAAAVFVICVATDWVDGWIARRTGSVTDFGRIADPFVDKIVVCGTCIYLVTLTPQLMKPGYVVVLVGREFLVTGLRGFIESRGLPFGARWGGKAKMVLQSVTIPAILLFEANKDALAGYPGWVLSFERFTVILVVLTIAATVLSAWDYIAVALRALRDNRSAVAPPASPAARPSETK